MEGARPRAPHEHGFNEKHAAKASIHRAPACGGRGRPPSMRIIQGVDYENAYDRVWHVIAAGASWTPRPPSPRMETREAAACCKIGFIPRGRCVILSRHDCV